MVRRFARRVKAKKFRLFAGHGFAQAARADAHGLGQVLLAFPLYTSKAANDLLCVGLCGCHTTQTQKDQQR